MNGGLEPSSDFAHVCPPFYVHRCPTHGDLLVIAWGDGTVDVLERDHE